MRLVTVPIDKIRQYPGNPRFITYESVEAVKESIRQTGYISPIVIDEINIILCGHTRLRALYQLGYTDVDCIRVEGLTAEQKRKFRLLDNKTAELAAWDFDRLREELDGLDFGDFDFWSKELERMADKALEESEPENDLVVCPRCGKIVSGLVGDGQAEEQTWTRD